jgi:predicted nucleotidyltransferase
MTVLDAVLAYLEGRRVAAVVIGGVALAVHGIARATWDIDLLVVDRTVLEPRFWAAWSGPTPDVRRGDADDPLAGVIRFSGATEPIDVVVGRDPWQRDLLARAVPITVGGRRLPVVDAADLVLLKLHAGGPQDLLDIELLVTANVAIGREVDARLAALPKDLQALWRTVRSRIDSRGRPPQ